MKKSNRQSLIKRIIEENDIETQDELIQHLKNEGLDATQATVSRDVRELNIVKGHSDEGKVKYMILEQGIPLTEERLKEVIQDSVEKVTRVQFMLILHTFLGSADIVAAVLDEIDMAEIAGTIAGTDTLVIITHNDEQAKKIYELVHSFIQ